MWSSGLPLDTRCAVGRSGTRVPMPAGFNGCASSQGGLDLEVVLEVAAGHAPSRGEAQCMLLIMRFADHGEPPSGRRATFVTASTPPRHHRNDKWRRYPVS